MNTTDFVQPIDLAQVNVWLDVIFTTLIIVVPIALGAHFAAFVFTGRFRRSFIEGHWPHHEEPHPPAFPKVLHFVHLAMMVVLAFSGMYVHFPFFDGGRTAMRWVHYVAMVIVGVVFFVRVWYAFYSSRRDYKEFAVGKRDLASLFGVAAYYLYLSNDKPHVAKYNVLQKLSYDGFALLMIVQGFTGLNLIMTPFLFGHSPRYWMTFWWADLIGGVAMAGAWMRIVHYTVNWAFILMTCIHAYLAATADVPAAVDFFGIDYGGKIAWRDDPSLLEGHGSHGSGGHDEAPPAAAPSASEAY